MASLDFYSSGLFLAGSRADPKRSVKKARPEKSCAQRDDRYQSPPAAIINAQNGNYQTYNDPDHLVCFAYI